MKIRLKINQEEWIWEGRTQHAYDFLNNALESKKDHSDILTRWYEHVSLPAFKAEWLKTENGPSPECLKKSLMYKEALQLIRRPRKNIFLENMFFSNHQNFYVSIMGHPYRQEKKRVFKKKTWLWSHRPEFFLKSWRQKKENASRIEVECKITPGEKGVKEVQALNDWLNQWNRQRGSFYEMEWVKDVFQNSYRLIITVDDIKLMDQCITLLKTSPLKAVEKVEKTLMNFRFFSKKMNHQMMELQKKINESYQWKGSIDEEFEVSKSLAQVLLKEVKSEDSFEWKFFEKMEKTWVKNKVSPDEVMDWLETMGDHDKINKQVWEQKKAQWDGLNLQSVLRKSHENSTVIKPDGQRL